MEGRVMNSKLVIVTGWPFNVFCLGCGEQFWAGDIEDQEQSPVYADLTGKPFQAYYCGPCANERSLVLDAAQIRQVLNG